MGHENGHLTLLQSLASGELLDLADYYCSPWSTPWVLGGASPSENDGLCLFPDWLLLTMPVMLAFLALEVLVVWKSGRLMASFSPMDTMVSLSAGLSRQFFMVILSPITFMVYRGLMYMMWGDALLTSCDAGRDVDHSRDHDPLKGRGDQGHSFGSVASALWVFLLVDLLFYGFHFLAHKVRVLYSLHFAHHSSRHFNGATAIRQGALQDIVVWVVAFPAGGLLGICPSTFASHAALNFFLQYWIHVPSLYSPLDAIRSTYKGEHPSTRNLLQKSLAGLGWLLSRLFNNPRAHAVHHSSTPEHASSNYGGVLNVWDVLFGTYTDPGSVASPLEFGHCSKQEDSELLLSLVKINTIPFPSEAPLQSPQALSESEDPVTVVLPSGPEGNGILGEHQGRSEAVRSAVSGRGGNESRRLESRAPPPHPDPQHHSSLPVETTCSVYIACTLAQCTLLLATLLVGWTQQRPGVTMLSFCAGAGGLFSCTGFIQSFLREEGGITVLPALFKRASNGYPWASNEDIQGHEEVGRSTSGYRPFDHLFSVVRPLEVASARNSLTQAFLRELSRNLVLGISFLLAGSFTGDYPLLWIVASMFSIISLVAQLLLFRTHRHI